jgi:hypothetical protein
MATTKRRRGTKTTTRRTRGGTATTARPQGIRRPRTKQTARARQALRPQRVSPKPLPPPDRTSLIAREASPRPRISPVRNQVCIKPGEDVTKLNVEQLMTKAMCLCHWNKKHTEYILGVVQVKYHEDFEKILSAKSNTEIKLRLQFWADEIFRKKPSWLVSKLPPFTVQTSGALVVLVMGCLAVKTLYPVMKEASQLVVEIIRTLSHKNVPITYHTYSKHV